MNAFNQVALADAQRELNGLLAMSAGMVIVGWMWLVRTWREVAHHFR